MGVLHIAGYGIIGLSEAFSQSKIEMRATKRWL